VLRDLANAVVKTTKAPDLTIRGFLLRSTPRATNSNHGDGSRGRGFALAPPIGSSLARDQNTRAKPEGARPESLSKQLVEERSADPMPSAKLRDGVDIGIIGIAEPGGADRHRCLREIAETPN
jgi:hypothetical protein